MTYLDAIAVPQLDGKQLLQAAHSANLNGRSQEDNPVIEVQILPDDLVGSVGYLLQGRGEIWVQGSHVFFFRRRNC